MYSRCWRNVDTPSTPRTLSLSSMRQTYCIRASMLDTRRLRYCPVSLWPLFSLCGSETLSVTLSHPLTPYVPSPVLTTQAKCERCNTMPWVEPWGVTAYTSVHSRLQRPGLVWVNCRQPAAAGEYTGCLPPYPWYPMVAIPRSGFVKLGNQAIRLHEAKRTNGHFGTSAKMAPVWADRESASCGLSTIKQASGCNSMRPARTIVPPSSEPFFPPSNILSSYPLQVLFPLAVLLAISIRLELMAIYEIRPTWYRNYVLSLQRPITLALYTTLVEAFIEDSDTSNGLSCRLFSLSKSFFRIHSTPTRAYSDDA
ncbi:hypothetical protein F5B21DRAFT_329583 [Xylaria acuta]|nr:hypothetical protein F5B21DRAFT_329583 [Xylaria acuta]